MNCVFYSSLAGVTPFVEGQQMRQSMSVYHNPNATANSPNDYTSCSPPMPPANWRHSAPPVDHGLRFPHQQHRRAAFVIEQSDGNGSAAMIFANQQQRNSTTTMIEQTLLVQQRNKKTPAQFKEVEV